MPPFPSAPSTVRRPNHGRRPLALKNPPATTSTTTNRKPPPQILAAHGSNKENLPPIRDKKEPIASFAASLEEELIAVRAAVERRRADKEATEKALNAKAEALDLQSREVSRRAEMQKRLEMEVDRLYRLKEIKLACLRVSPIRSLREKEEEKKKKKKLQLIEHSM